MTFAGLKRRLIVSLSALVIAFALSGCLAEEVATSTSNFSASDFSGADLASATSSSSISVSWTMSESSIVTGYRIYEMDEALQLTPLGVVGRSSSSYLATDLEPESNHYYVVRALLSDGGVDENMKFVSATTLETDPLSVSPSATSIATGTIKKLIASGGASPYSFNILSGGGVIHPSTGEFVAPSVGGLTTVRVVDSAGAVVISSITIVSQVVISPKYRQLQLDRKFQITASSGSPPYTFSIISGSSLATLDSTTNTITPTGATGLILVRVTDSNGIFDDATVSIVDQYFPKWTFDIGYTACIANSGLDYSAKCWGSNNASKLGNQISPGASENSMGDNLSSINFGSLTVKSVQVGKQDSAPCALFSDDQVRCWGASWIYVKIYSGVSGQDDVGDASGELQAMPAMSFGTGRTVKQLELGEGFGCVILDNDKVKCWGIGDNGRLGLGSTTSYTSSTSLGDGLPFLDLGTGRTAKQLALIDTAACAILDNDKLKCWGYGGAGRLGNESTSFSYGDSPGEMGDALPYVNLGTGRTVKKVSGSGSHFCAILDNDLLKCWGAGSDGKLGVGSTANIGDGPGEMGDSLAYVDLGVGRTVKDVSAGYTHTCAILDNDLLKCWGNAGSGEIGLGSTNDQGDSLSEMGDALPYVDLGTGKTASILHGKMGQMTCVGLNDLSTKCWGSNTYGTLGQEHTTNIGNNLGQMGDSLPPINLGSGRTAVQMAGASALTCAVLDDATLKCWGVPHYGSGDDKLMCIGDDTSELSSSLADTPLSSNITIKSIHTSEYNSCALLSDGNAKCWGREGYGMFLSDLTGEVGALPNSMGDNLPNLDFGINLTVKQLSLARAHACAILNNDKIKCWGFGNVGRLGNGSNSNIHGGSNHGDSLPYIDLGTGRTAKKLISYENSNCALLDNDKIKCWGYGAGGILGSGDTNNRGDDPGEMGDNLGYIDLGTGLVPVDFSMGYLFGCAVFSNNKVKCWGYNSAARLGLGDTQNRGDDPGEMGDNLPFVDLGTTETIVKIQSGYVHTCVLFANEKVKCWGYGNSGRLGSGNTNNLGDGAGEMGANLPYINLGNRQAKDLFVGRDQTCIQLENDDLTCFGLNSTGVLRTGNFSSLGDSSTEVGSNIFLIKKD